MNHLAHCYLSFHDEDVLIGNFSGDFVKGHDWQQYPEPVQRGLLLHRSIDAFTDNHPQVRASMARLRPYAGRYAGPVHDIVADHLLVRQWSAYSSEPFDTFAERTYRVLEQRAPDMPVILRARVPQMVAGRFLHGYQSRAGLEWVLERFSRRLPPDFNYAALIDYFFTHISAFEADFNAFFPALIRYVQEWKKP